MIRVSQLSSGTLDVVASNDDLIAFSNDELVSATTLAQVNAGTISLEQLQPNTQPQVTFTDPVTLTTVTDLDTLNSVDIITSNLSADTITTTQASLTNPSIDTLTTTTLTSTTPSVSFGSVTSSYLIVPSSVSATSLTVDDTTCAAVTISGNSNFTDTLSTSTLTIQPQASFTNERLLRFTGNIPTNFAFPDTVWTKILFSSSDGAAANTYLTALPNGSVRVTQALPDGYIDIIFTLFWIDNEINVYYLTLTGDFYMASFITPPGGDMTNFYINPYEQYMRHIDAFDEIAVSCDPINNAIGLTKAYGSNSLRKRIPTSYLSVNDEIQFWVLANVGMDMQTVSNSYANIIINPSL